jgi:hypothetical protein
VCTYSGHLNPEYVGTDVFEGRMVNGKNETIGSFRCCRLQDKETVERERARMLAGPPSALAEEDEDNPQEEDPCGYGAWGEGGARRQPSLPSLACAMSGMFMGMADPDESLAPFMIPSNPISWTLNAVCAKEDAPAAAGEGGGGGASNKTGAVFGAGLFDDAGDVSGHPVLFFALFGSFTEEGAAEGKRGRGGGGRER